MASPSERPDDAGFAAAGPILKPRSRPVDPSEPRDFEAGMRLLPPFSLVMIAACIGVFIWQFTTGALASAEAIISAGALTRDGVLAGEWWRLASCTVLHGDIDHLLGNIVMLYVAGIGVEHGIGSGRTVLLYVVSGLVGSLASIAVSPGPSLGASGAIFGLIGALAVILLRQRKQLQPQHAGTGIFLVLWSLWALVTGLLQPMIDNAAHAGGLLAGALLAGCLVLKTRARVL